MAEAWCGIVPVFTQDLPWEHFECQLNQFYLINKLDKNEDIKKAILLSQTGQEIIQKAWALLSPENPSTKSYTEIWTALDDYYKTPENKRRARFDFHSRVRQQHEKIADFALSLKALSRRCVFGTFEEEALIDQMIWGVNNSSIQRNLINAN